MKASKAGNRRDRLAIASSPSPFSPPTTQSQANAQLAFLNAKLQEATTPVAQAYYRRACRPIIDRMASLPAS